MMQANGHMTGLELRCGCSSEAFNNAQPRSLNATKALADLLASSPHLQRLSLRSCGLSGPLPARGWPAGLTHLALPGNQLSGQIDGVAWAGMKSVGEIDLSDNRLAGWLPHAFGALSGLTSL
jgi:hypothetical protein